MPANDGVNIRGFSNVPLKKRLVVSMLAMLLPLVVLGVGTLVTLNTFLAAFISITDETVEEIQPNMRVQAAMAGAMMHIDHYLVNGEARTLTDFARDSREVDRDFAVLLGAHNLTKERPFALMAQEKWREAKAAAWSVLRISNPIDNRAALAQREHADRLAHESAQLLERANAIHIQFLQDDLETARRTRQRTLVVMAGIFGLALAGAFFAGYKLAQTIVWPITALEEGALRLTAGDLSHRVSVRTDDEFGHLGKSFNIMAGRLEKSQAKLEKLATHDALTGVYNRRAFFQSLDEEIKRSRRHKTPFALLMLDIDHFKQVNDRFGHQAGDEVLRRLCTIVTGVLRDIDKLARYGGEEFIVILPQTPGDGAVTTAKRICRAIEDAFAEFGGRRLRLTVSIGVAEFPDDAKTGDELVGRADAALYLGKRSGRNQVRKWTGPTAA